MPSSRGSPLPSPPLSTALDLLLLSTVHSEALLFSTQPDANTLACLPRPCTISETAPALPTCQAMSSPAPPETLLIACLESYVSPALPIGTSLSNDATAPALQLIPATTLSKLKTVGSARVKDMRNLGHSRQIVSHIPIIATPTTCAKFNDSLYSSIQLQPEKISALAMLPNNGKEAAKELQRCVTKLKFVGGVVGVDSRGGGAALADPSYDSLWDMAERFRVPIALRELWPTGAEVRRVPLLPQTNIR